MKKFYAIIVSDAELDFAVQLVSSKLAVTIDNVETVAAFKHAVIKATEIPQDMLTELNKLNESLTKVP